MSLPDDIQMDKDNILLFGLTACALGLSLFILLGPKLGRRNASNCALVGLQNLGLTCFLNSLLQALASCPSFIYWLQSEEGNGSVSKSLSSILRLLCYERQPDIEEVFSPNDLIYNLRDKVWPVFPQEQDPHELFLHILTAIEEEEQKAKPERVDSLLDALGSPETEEDTFSQVSSHGDVPRFKRLRSMQTDKPKVTPSPFRGYLASQLSCTTCTNKSAVVYDKFDTLSLALPARNEVFKLQHLLDNFVSAEIVEGFACDHCNKGRSAEHSPILSLASKAIKIGKLPKCLCFHISRTYMDSNGYMYKRENYVDFPEYLSMGHYTHTSSMLKEKKFRKVRTPSSVNSPLFYKGGQSSSVSANLDSEPTLTKYKALASPDQSNNSISEEEEYGTPVSSQGSGLNISLPNNNNTLFSHSSLFLDKRLFGGPYYRLKAVVEHRGNVDTGHFVTYRRGPLQTEIRHRWYFTSDEIVKNSSLADALSAHAYLLFYEKCEKIN
ncbi:ubiquitin carboxyl-terminal hydrolase 30 homolog isoform X2 [Cimex lectularius]|uniref:ubiquitinyl hydrolase 1 n=1 Tax=Cimex lectularius TaxID=79782 RepID=A0A8I6SKY4_CIMLE|nr:ubiquitin carboxyl-terminal hydrolase 30 homolog isoform X2 [Cimex lectularius]